MLFYKNHALFSIPPSIVVVSIACTSTPCSSVTPPARGGPIKRRLVTTEPITLNIK